MRICVTGAEGQLGWSLQRVFRDTEHTVIPLGKDDLDITNRQHIDQVVSVHHPDVIINCAAYNRVETAGDDIALAYTLNAFGPYWLSLSAKKINATLVHVSTDYVFDGLEAEYSETSTPHPLNVYGASKLAGEQLVTLTQVPAYIIRTSWLFGVNARGMHQNFVGTMLARAQEDKVVNVVSDQYGVPTSTMDLAAAIRHLLEHHAPFGLYHITNSGVCSRYEQARKIFELSGITANVTPISTEESGSLVRRPARTVLKNTRWESLGFPPLRGWEEALADYIHKSVI